MSLYNERKMGNLKKAEGKYVGATTKAVNYEYGRNRAKKIAAASPMAKALGKAKK